MNASAFLKSRDIRLTTVFACFYSVKVSREGPCYPEWGTAMPIFPIIASKRVAISALTS